VDPIRHEPLDTQAIFRGLWRRHKLLMAFLLFGILLPGLVLVFWTTRPSYVSTASIAIESSPLEQMALVKDAPRRDTVETALALLRSRSVAEAVVEALPRETMEELLTHARHIDYFLVASNAVKSVLGKPVTVMSPQQRALEELSKARMEFVQDREASGIIKVNGTASSPRIAMDLVNTYIQVLLGRTRNTNQEDAHKARQFLETQIQQAKDNLHQTEDTLTKFQQQRGRIQLGGQTDLDVQRLSQTESALAEAQASQNVLVARIQALRQAIAGRPAGRSEGTDAGGVEPAQRLLAFKAAQDRLARLEEKLSALRERYTDANPLVQVTEDEIAKERARVVQMAKDLPASRNGLAPMATDRIDAERQLAALQNEEAGQRARVDLLKQQLDRLRGGLKNLNQDEMESSRLRAAVESQRNLLTVLSDKLMTTRMREQGESTLIRIIDPASFPLGPTQTRTVQLMLAVVALAFGSAFGAGFGLEYWRQPVETEGDVRKATDLPVLGSVGVISGPRINPKVPGRPQSVSLPIPVGTAPAAGIHVELYRAIRATIEAERLKAPFRTLLVTSPNPSEGKSTTTLNLAQAFQEFGRRVLVVEADLRRPALFRTFSLTNKPGILDLVRGTASFEQAARRLPSGVTLLPGQISREDTSALLASPAFAEVLRQAAADFDLVLLDSAPILAVPDNLLLAPMIDRVILVARASQTSKRELARAAGILTQVNARILGVILNQASAIDVHYYHHRYHKYYRLTDPKDTAAHGAKLLSRKGQ
jgi:polysaccharide biosynthesis transport protein